MLCTIVNFHFSQLLSGVISYCKILISTLCVYTMYYYVYFTIVYSVYLL